MGPSLVISTVTSMATGWNRNSLTSSDKSSNSYTEEDEDEDHLHQTSSIQSGTKHIVDTFQIDHTSFPRQLDEHSKLNREHHPPTSSVYNTRSSSSSSLQFDVSGVSAVTQKRDDSTFQEYAISPLFLPNPYLPGLEGDVRRGPPISSNKEDQDEEDDRKPRAVQLLNQCDTTEQKDQSIANDPSQQAQVHQRLPSNEQFIDPTFSFGDDDIVGVRNFEEGQEIVQNVWGVSTEELNDPLSDLNRRHHFSPPHADFHTPSRYTTTSYASVHPPIAFRLGDNNESSAPLSGVPNEHLLTIDVHPTSSSQSQVRNLVLKRRFASAIEIESAETDRARSAIHVWYQRFNELIDYCELYGDCNVPQKYPPNQQLGIWVNKQRMEKKFMDERRRTSMTATKVEALDSIGFTWAKRKGDASWMLKFNELKEYLKTFGSCDVPTKYTPNPALGRWVSTQRSEYKVFMSTGGRSRHLTQEKIDMLNRIGFKWEMIPSRLSNSSGHSNSSGTTESGGTSSTRRHNLGDHVPHRQV